MAKRVEKISQDVKTLDARSSRVEVGQQSV